MRERRGEGWARISNCQHAMNKIVEKGRFEVRMGLFPKPHQVPSAPSRDGPSPWTLQKVFQTQIVFRRHTFQLHEVQGLGPSREGALGTWWVQGEALALSFDGLHWRTFRRAAPPLADINR